jgi:hypothetical protein|nr:MAG TPA: hypothetical protein [Caudoviricetes sp.]
MTKMELMMLSICFGMNLGWLLSIVITLIIDGIRTLKKKHKIKKEQKIYDDKERTGDDL